MLIPIITLSLFAAQSDKAIPLKLSQPQTIKLQKKKKQDYTIALTKGSYRIVLDSKGTDEQNALANCVQGSVKLMKQNGATDSALNYDFIGWYEFDAFHREVKTLTVKKNTAIRLRVQNSDLSIAEDTLTVVPVTSGFTPFGFGARVEEAKVGDENGTGGKIDYLGYAYYRAKLPVGEWSVSLGLRRPDGTNAYVCGTLAILDDQGKRTQDEPSKIDVTEDTGRVEKIISVKKPRTIIIRVKNISNNQGSLNYDVTVRPNAK